MSAADTSMIRLDGVAKTFVMHLRGGATLPVLKGVTFEVRAGECAVLDGPSGAGKSSILKMIFGNYRADAGSIMVRDAREWVDVASAPPRRVLHLRQATIGYVSQFLRTIPRVGALDIVAASARDNGIEPAKARARAAELLDRLNIPEQALAAAAIHLLGRRAAAHQHRARFRGDASRSCCWTSRPPRSTGATARPSSSSFASASVRGAALLGIFHDEDVKQQVCDRSIDVTNFRA